MCLDKENSNTQTTVNYVGLSVRQAKLLAAKTETPFRVVMEDGNFLPATKDFRVGRINATVKNGVIVSYDIEGE